MLWSGTAATTNHLHAQIFHEVHQRHAQLHRRQTVVSLTAHVLWQSGVGDAGDGEGGAFRQVAYVLLHQVWPGGTVEAEDIQGIGLQHRQRRGHIRSGQHRALTLHRHRHHQRSPFSLLRERGFNAVQRCFNLQHIHAGFHQEQVCTTVKQPFCLFPIRRFQRVVVDVAQGG